MKRHVLSLNCGSSSLKYALFEGDETDQRSLARDEVSGIGDAIADHGAAVDRVLDELARTRLPAPDAIAHRIVHGGSAHTRPERIDDALLASLRALVPLARLHLPAEIRAVEAGRARFPEALHVACFDTAFHRTMPEVAQRLPLPRHFFDEGVIRYGFHGLSYEFVVETIGARALGRAVIAHLGSGASLCAVRDGRSVDTTMGFTPTGGIVMGTRAGDLDPGLLIYLLDQGYDARSLERLVNHEAGLLGLSGTTGDMKKLLDARTRDAPAAMAVESFCWHARKAIAALAASAGGLDALVFTGGIGARSAVVRKSIVDGLGHLGVHLDDALNEKNAAIVSRGRAPVTVHVVVTDEERQCARHALRLLGAAP